MKYEVYESKYTWLYTLFFYGAPGAQAHLFYTLCTPRGNSNKSLCALIIRPTGQNIAPPRTVISK